MAETEYHLNLMFRVIQLLRDHYADDPMAYVVGNMLLFYEKGNRRKHIAPDCFVVFGVRKKIRTNYLVWEEGKGPDIVFEFTSESTRREDMRTKFEIYRDVLKVKEYILFDPLKQYLSPQLQGYRLTRGKYVPIPVDRGRLSSSVLKLDIEADGETLHFWEPKTGQKLVSAVEEENRRLQAELSRLRHAQKYGGLKNGH
jgi:Uma2 family endonuclease